MLTSEEDRRMVNDLQEQVSVLTNKVKVYKRQVEEAVSTYALSAQIDALSLI